MSTEIARAHVQIQASAKGITGQLEKELRPLGDAADEAGTKAGRGFGASFERATGQSLSSFGTKALIGAAALGVGLFAVTKAAGNLSAAFAANEQVLGEASKAVQTWAKDSVKNVGLSERATLEAATSFGQLAKVAGMSGDDIAAFSMEFVTLAADMAAFKDVPVEQALADLQSGFAGQPEVLRKYGVFLDEASLKTAYFSETGQRVTGTLTAQQRVLATQSAILASTADIQGQAGRESDGFARQLDNLKATAENAAASLGESVLPAMSDLVGFAATAVKGFGGLNDATGGLASKFLLFSAAGLATVGGLAKLASVAGTARDAFARFSTAIGGVSFSAMLAPLAILAAGLWVVQRRLADIARLKAFDVEAVKAFVVALEDGHVSVDEFYAALKGDQERPTFINMFTGDLEDLDVVLDGLDLSYRDFQKIVDKSIQGTLDWGNAQIAAGKDSEAVVKVIDAAAETRIRLAEADEEAARQERLLAEGTGLLSNAFRDALVPAEGLATEIEGAADSTEGLGTMASSTLEVMSRTDRAFADAARSADSYPAALDGVFGGSSVHA